MIPAFPQFKPIELSDKEQVEKITQKYPQYSDFNFVSMWSWDIKGEMRLSILNGNLVVRFTDYLTGEPFFSFIGDNEINNTAEILLQLSKKEGLGSILKMVPEHSIKNLDTTKFKIEDDRDHFDYIYNISELKNFPGGKFARKRNEVSNFLKKYPEAEAKIIDLKDKNVDASIVNLFLEWIKVKISKEGVYESHEEVAVDRLLLAVDICNFLCVGVFVDSKLIGFLINEPLEGEYVLAHASKTNKTFSGINGFLMNKNGEFLDSIGKKLFNYEQDLGMENLRDAKTRFRPTLFLKKYQLTYN